MKDTYAPNILPSSPIPKKEEYPKYWAERTVPIEGELLSSWMTRTALANLNSLTSLLKGLTNRPPHFIDFDTHWYSEIMNLFIEKTGISESKLQDMSLIDMKKSKDTILEKYEQNTKNTNILNIMWIARLVWDHDSRGAYCVRYCPECLWEDDVPYFRKEWRIGYNLVCLEHECLLENRCPICEAPVGYNRLDWDFEITECWYCKSDLTQTRPIYLSPKDPLLEVFKDFYASEEEVFEVLALTWIIAKSFKVGDVHNGEPPHPIYNNHPLTKDKNLIEFWQEHLDRNKMRQLTNNLPAMFLAMGTALTIWQYSDIFDDFLNKYHLSRDFAKTNRPFCCPFEECSRTFTRLDIALEHINRHTGDRNFECDIENCGKKFFSERELKAHRGLHNLPHPFSCPIDDCGKLFRNEKDYIHHIRSDHHIRPYTCDFCHKSFNRKRLLNTHLRTHTGEKPFVCEFCEKQFAQWSALRSHIFSHTGEKPYKCDICGEGFSQSHSLTEHIRTHTGEKPYICSTCGEIFSRKHHLEGHIRTHTGEKPFICKECGKAFADKGNLTKHLVVHTGECPFVCGECGQAFKYKSNLNSHKTSHTGEKPFVCKECGKRFARKDSLKTHIKTHSGEKPFVCDKCKKSYTTKKSLQRHIEAEHLKKRWECPYCEKSYSRRDKLKDHAEKHHAGKPI